MSEFHAVVSCWFLMSSYYYCRRRVFASCVTLRSCGSMLLRLCFDSLNTFLSLIVVSVSPRDPKNRPLDPGLLPRETEGWSRAEAASAPHRAVSVSASSGKTISSGGRMWGKREAGAGAGGEWTWGGLWVRMSRTGWRFLSAHKHEAKTHFSLGDVRQSDRWRFSVLCEH